jgi:hypothetical protein
MPVHPTTPWEKKNASASGGSTGGGGGSTAAGGGGGVSSYSKWDKYDPDAEGDDALDGMVFERSEYEVLRSRACLPHALRRVLDYLKQGLAMPPTQGVGAARTARGQRKEARLSDGARLVDWAPGYCSKSMTAGPLPPPPPLPRSPPLPRPPPRPPRRRGRPLRHRGRPRSRSRRHRPSRLPRRRRRSWPRQPRRALVAVQAAASVAELTPDEAEREAARYAGPSPPLPPPRWDSLPGDPDEAEREAARCI